jgi:hypothetical protein
MTPNTEKVVMVKAGPLINVPALMYAIAESRRLYTDFGNPPPPNPEKLASCSSPSSMTSARENGLAVFKSYVMMQPACSIKNG